MNPVKYLSFSLAILTLGLTTASADTTAFVEGGTLTQGAQGTGGTGIVGFNFTVNSSISVTQLGFFGDSLGGGDTPWAALYDVTTATQLASISFTAGTAINGWNYVAITPVTLTAGDTYQIVANAYWSPQYADQSGFTFGSAINPVSVSASFTTPTGWGGSWGTPVEATNGFTTTPNITANFLYTAASPVPEPSTYAALFGVAALGYVMIRRRRS